MGLAADDDFHATSEIAAESIMEICPKAAGAGRAITDRCGHRSPAKSSVIQGVIVKLTVDTTKFQTM